MDVVDVSKRHIWTVSCSEDILRLHKIIDINDDIYDFFGVCVLVPIIIWLESARGIIKFNFLNTVFRDVCII